MEDVHIENNTPIKFWLPLGEVDEGAFEQAKNLARLPFTHKHVAIMPDTHQGYGMPIGGVLATKNVIVPNAVGVDIGCGMCAVQTDIDASELRGDNLKQVMGKIRDRVPVGFKHHDEPQGEKYMPEDVYDHLPIVSQEYDSALKQVGTLGGGNHFLEIQHDEDGNVWIMIHSGSRNLGYTVAEHYHEKAKELCNKWYSDVPNEDLAFLPVDTEEAENYINEMRYCVEFALASRKLMMRRSLEALEEVVGEHEQSDLINIAHNYANLENHFNKNVWVHRKGATLAREGTKGIIPGSQGDNSYIVTGKGNEQSFCSCSHGAGRTMSRTKAKENIDMEKSKSRMDEKGILHAIRNKDDMDEAPEAYKDISEVIERQDDLIDVNYKLTPMGVVKG